MATNYITCATIDRLKFNELLTLYPVLSDLLRKEVINYKDPLKCFMEMRLNQMEFFKNLPKIVKNDFIFNMEQKSFEKGQYFYRNNDESKEMIIMQSGCIHILQKMEKNQTFIMEKLFRGSIINHNSFLMNDEMDTDAYCKTNVHCYSMSIDRLTVLREKYS